MSTSKIKNYIGLSWTTTILYWADNVSKRVSLRGTTDNSDVYCTMFLILINSNVLNSFLRFTCFVVGIFPNFINITNLLDLLTLAERRRILNIKCIHGLITNQIHSPLLLSQINFKVSSYATHSQKTFNIPSQHKSFTKWAS